MGTDGAVLDEQARKIQSEMAATGKFRAISSNAALDRPEVIVEPDLAPAGRTRHFDGDARRRRCASPRSATSTPIWRSSRSATARSRSACSSTRAARDDIAVVSTAAGADAVRRHRAAVVGGEDPLRPGAVLDRRASTASAASSSAPTWRRAPSSARASAPSGQLPAVKDMPAGTRIQETGDAEIMGEVFAGFATAMSTGLMLVLVVLILLFGSVFHSFTILGSLPLAIGGVVAALWLTNSAVSMPVVIGILMLMGIVTKNAIMLVDFAIEEVKQRRAAQGGDHRCRPQARAADRHDHHRHVGGHDPGGAGARRRRRVPRADGDRGGRRPAGLDLPVAGLRAVLLHDHGRRRDRHGQAVPLAGAAERGRRARRGALASVHTLPERMESLPIAAE